MITNYAPTTQKELQEQLAFLTPESKIVSGGTDLTIQLNQGALTPDALLYMGRLAGIQAITVRTDSITLGAGVTMAQLAAHPEIIAHYTAVADGAKDVGSPQIRNLATIGGNVGNASPAGDLLPPLYLLKGTVTVAGPKGLRQLAIEDIIKQPSKTTLSPQETILSFTIPKPDPQLKTAFIKLGFRKRVTISRIGLAGGIVFGEDNSVKDCTLIVGAISVKPVSAEKSAALLIGQQLNDEVKLAASQELSNLILDITPEHFDRDYKMHAAKGIVHDLLDLLASR